MDLNLLIISIVGLSVGVVCLGVGVWLFRKKIVTVLERVQSVTTEESKPESTLLDLSSKLKEFEEKTA